MVMMAHKKGKQTESDCPAHSYVSGNSNFLWIPEYKTIKGQKEGGFCRDMNNDKPLTSHQMKSLLHQLGASSWDYKEICEINNKKIAKYYKGKHK